MIVAPSSSRSATSLTTLPVTPAGTMIQTARGRSRFATRSAADSAPVAPSDASVAIGAGARVPLPRGPLGGERRDRGGIPVPPHHLVPGAHQPAGEIGTHPAQADHSE